MKHISYLQNPTLIDTPKKPVHHREKLRLSTDLEMDDVPENEVLDISEFEHYKVKLINNGG